MFREGLCRLLEGEGHETLAAENGLEALRLLSDTAVDLVLADVYMPPFGMDEMMAVVEKALDQGWMTSRHTTFLPAAGAVAWQVIAPNRCPKPHR